MSRDPRRDNAFREQICEWLRANGLNPGDIPIGATVLVSNEWITTTVWGRTPQGDRKIDPMTHRPLYSDVTVPMLVPPEDDVAKWVIRPTAPPCPNCGHAPAPG